ncbi:hypothetical protein L208DRAFT_116760 [Tricholoma matsutake]|nr:hypothetical protein L208DRAFT_116760 [Tricholoma matsutake 945]
MRLLVYFILFYFLVEHFPRGDGIGALTKLQSRCPLGVPRILRPQRKMEKCIYREEMHLRTECGAQLVLA